MNLTKNNKIIFSISLSFILLCCAFLPFLPSFSSMKVAQAAQMEYDLSALSFPFIVERSVSNGSSNFYDTGNQTKFINAEPGYCYKFIVEDKNSSSRRAGFKFYNSGTNFLSTLPFTGYVTFNSLTSSGSPYFSVAGFDVGLISFKITVYRYPLDETQYNAGYSEGYQIGLNDGYYNGYSVGKTDGIQEGYQSGFDSGYNIGFSDGTTLEYDDGFLAGRQAGLLEGYENGYSAGYSAGYDEGWSLGDNYGFIRGFNSGSQSALNGIFSNATYSAKIQYENSNTNSLISTPYFIHNHSFNKGLYGTTIYFNDFYSDFENLAHIQDYFLNYVEFTVNFQNNFIYQPVVYPFYLSGSSLGKTFSLIGDDNTVYTATVSYDYASVTHKIVFPSSATGKSIKALRIDFQGAYNTFEGALSTVEAGYSSGYEAGYLKGKFDGIEEITNGSVDIEKSSDYQIGFSAGYSAGASSVIGSDYSFFSLFSAVVDAPVSVFSSLLDFEILGFNLKTLILSLFSIAIVLCVVRFFLGLKG